MENTQTKLPTKAQRAALAYATGGLSELYINRHKVVESLKSLRSYRPRKRVWVPAALFSLVVIGAVVDSGSKPPAPATEPAPAPAKVVQKTVRDYYNEQTTLLNEKGEECRYVIPDELGLLCGGELTKWDKEQAEKETRYNQALQETRDTWVPEATVRMYQKQQLRDRGIDPSYLDKEYIGETLKEAIGFD